MLSYLKLLVCGRVITRPYMGHKINSISSLLAYTQEFSLAILHNLSFYTDISKNNLFLLNQIVQGVCSCFSLFNLQGTSLLSQPMKTASRPHRFSPPSWRRLTHYSTFSFVCQALFSTFFKNLSATCTTCLPNAWLF